MAKNFKELEVWRKSHELVLTIYTVTAHFPSIEKYRLTDQVTRSAMSVAMNIAEGTGRKTKKDMSHFFIIARASIEETKYLIMLSKDLNLISLELFHKITNELEQISRMLNALLKSLNKPT